jgi:hypothetical protein
MSTWHSVKSSFRLEALMRPKSSASWLPILRTRSGSWRMMGCAMKRVGACIRLWDQPSLSAVKYMQHSQHGRQAYWPLFPIAFRFNIYWIGGGSGAVLILLIAIMSTAVYGWWHRILAGYFWMGYSLLRDYRISFFDIITCRFNLIALSSIPLALWLIIWGLLRL